MILILIILTAWINESLYSQERVVTGAEILLTEHTHLIQGKNIGIITNHTGILPDGRHIVDILYEKEAFTLTAIFSPEHGFRGVLDKPVADKIDPVTSIPIYSLYGEVRKPTAEMLRDIDVLIFDIQDVGARFYTYISTLNHTMEAAAENNIRFILTDRPNPIGAGRIEGIVLDPEFRSFIGIQPIPVIHGMTVGELALLFNGEGWLTNGISVDLIVIPMRNYSRTYRFEDTGLSWIKPSPNMLHPVTAEIYPATVFMEGTNISEGRGTENPFEQIGAPWIDRILLADKLNSYNLPGVKFETVRFTPTDRVEGILIHPPKYIDQLCEGVKIVITDRETFMPVKTGLYLLYSIFQLYGDELEITPVRFDRLWGTDSIRQMLINGSHPDEIIISWEKNLNKYRRIRERYLLYDPD